MKIGWIGCKKICKVLRYLIIYNLWQLNGKTRFFALVKIETELTILALEKYEILQPSYIKVG